MLFLNSFSLARKSGISPITATLVLCACASGPEQFAVGLPPMDEIGRAYPDVQAGEPGEAGHARETPPLAASLYEQAIASMTAGDTLLAERQFNEFLLQYPDYPGVHVNLAIIFAGRGDLQAAESSLAEALTLDPGHARALNQLGMLLRQQGKFEEAKSAYLHALKSDPDYALAHYNLGVLNDLYLRRLDAALIHFERDQDLAGEDRQVRNWITDLKRRISRRQRTARLIE